MKRNIEEYTEIYINDGFRAEMTKYRRKKVLEIGCGIQSIIDFYDDYDEFTIVEPSAEFIKYIKKSKSFNNRVEIINNFLENIISSLKKKHFDFIILSSLLHEVPEPDKMLDDIYKICDKNTVLHVNVPNINSFHLLWAYKSGIIKLGELTERAKKLQQNTTYDLFSLEKTLNKNRFKSIDKGSYFIKPFNHDKMYQLLSEDIINSQLLDGLYNLTEYFPNNGAEIFINCKIKEEKCQEF
jgi:ubiquinone/menaquinone biosynthesis C-methylase UbiE